MKFEVRGTKIKIQKLEYVFKYFLSNQMTSMYSIIIIAYLLTQLTPTNKNLTLIVTTDIMSEKIIINYDAKAKKWSGKQEGKNDATALIVSVDKENQAFMFSDAKISINDLVVDDAKIDWKKVTSVNMPARDNTPNQSPINIKRNKKSIVLSQQQGDLTRISNITISW